ncbi:DUF397 domain-containing protein [Nocardia aurantiaca]|uniref:DUF397 domain-containing protein n=1 Tax=Nocardia aurantiaca TaxID=2675850 RepID=UPI001E2ED212|nr:DUF397 domain-containing protein [Nocardia aurantiaca]
MAPVDRREWRKSSYSGSNGGQCVEVAFSPAWVHIRDSKYSGSADRRPTISVPSDSWTRVLEAVLAQEVVDIGAACGIDLHPDGGATVSGRDGTELVFTAGEWDAFAKGVAGGEFDIKARMG